METARSDPAPTVSVLFVCLGNICRSPLAEGVFHRLLDEESLSGLVKVDSAGTGAWHVGELPDPRSADVARRNGVTLVGRARQVTGSDLAETDWVIAMDRANLDDLRALSRGNGDARPRLHLLREFDPEADAPSELDVPDPYYGGPGGFDRIYEIIERSCRALLDRMRDEHDL